MKIKFRWRRILVTDLAFVMTGLWLFLNPESYETKIDYSAEAITEASEGAPLAVEILEKLEVKGRAPKTGYSREEFYPGWPTV
ncbi:hypothetical protein IJH74_02630, partial [Candidatus Saccharibacteria bacterium]|nr:hypothetical protein [Candidatus Saccharibacteria bacterium]